MWRLAKKKKKMQERQRNDNGRGDDGDGSVSDVVVSGCGILTDRQAAPRVWRNNVLFIRKKSQAHVERGEVTQPVDSQCDTGARYF
jgi:hypothetical protein